MTDFEVVETVEFPADGSTITPAHKHRDFTFKTYSPVAFRLVAWNPYNQDLVGPPELSETPLIRIPRTEGTTAEIP